MSILWHDQSISIGRTLRYFLPLRRLTFNQSTEIRLSFEVNKVRLSSRFVVATSAAVLAATPVLAEKANQLVDVNGMSAASGERVLRDRGFAFVNHERNSQGYNYSYWWDERDDDCVRVEEYRGRIQMISDATDQDCGHHLNSGAKAVLGAAAGAAILGAIFGSKHNDDDRNDGQRDSDQEYDRGYNDGLHNASYHNRRGTDEYSAGYRAGVNQRNANLRHHARRGGYEDNAWIGRLVGAAGDGAATYLENQGFRPVDSFESGRNGAGSIWYNRSSRQCVQMIVVNGRVDSARDIGSSPSCR